MQPYGLGCESCGTRGRHAAECAAMCRCGVRVVECDRGTMAQHDERIKALADRELARRPAAPAFERDDRPAISPPAAAECAACGDAMDRCPCTTHACASGCAAVCTMHAAAAAASSLAARQAEADRAMRAQADAERAMTVDEWDTLRALCAMQAAAEAQHATDARARGSRSVTAEHDAKRYSALAAKCEARMSALRAGRVMP